jgi:hypothetical protein
METSKGKQIYVGAIIRESEDDALSMRVCGPTCAREGKAKKITCEKESPDSASISLQHVLFIQ